MEWNKKVKPGQVPKVDKMKIACPSPMKQSTVSHLLTNESAKSFKKRKVESISSSPTVSDDTSDQEPSSISTTSTLAEVLVQLESLQQLVKSQGELIAKLTKKSTTPQNVCVGEVKSVIQTVGKCHICKTDLSNYHSSLLSGIFCCQYCWFNFIRVIITDDTFLGNVSVNK